MANRVAQTNSNRTIYNAISIPKELHPGEPSAISRIYVSFRAGFGLPQLNIAWMHVEFSAKLLWIQQCGWIMEE